MNVRDICIEGWDCHVECWIPSHCRIEGRDCHVERWDCRTLALSHCRIEGRDCHVERWDCRVERRDCHVERWDYRDLHGHRSKTIPKDSSHSNN